MDIRYGGNIGTIPQIGSKVIPKPSRPRPENAFIPTSHNNGLWGKLIRRIKSFAKLLFKGDIDGILHRTAWNMPYNLFFYSHVVLCRSEKPTWTCCDQRGYDFRFATADDLDMLEDIKIPKKDALDRFAVGDKAIIAVKNGKISAMVWGGTARRFVKHAGLIFETDGQSAYYYSGYTRKVDRKKGLISTTLLKFYNYFLAQGRPINWILVSANDPAWLGAILKKNFTKAGEIFFFKIFSLNACFYKSWAFPTKKINIFFKNPPNGLIWS